MTLPRNCAKEAYLKSSSSIRISPSEIGNNLSKAFIIELLPEPVLPMIPTDSPDSI